MNELTPEEKEQIRIVLDRRTEEKRLKKGSPIYAGFWKRFMASSIDDIVLLVAGVIVSGLLSRIFQSPISKSLFNGPFLLLTSISNFLLYWLYYAIMESSSYQATIGKIMLDIVVTDLNGNRVSFFRASNRFFAKALSAFLLYFGFIIAGLTEKKQALHDIIASCLVVRR